MTSVVFSEFAVALLDVYAPLPPSLRQDAHAARFAVHQNTSRGALVVALRSAYPAILVALGEEYFDALAVEFMQQTSPASPVLQEYSPLFSDFLDGFAPLAQWPWLGDVARIDWCRREAYHARDVEPLTASQLQAWSVEALLKASLQLHPSLRALDSAHPAFSLWQRFLQPFDIDSDDNWQPHSVQVWRFDGLVRQRRLGPGEASFLRNLAEGRVIGQAMQRSQASEPAFDAASACAALISGGLVIAVNP